MRCESVEITLHEIVYVPSPSPPSRGMTTLTSTTLGRCRDRRAGVVEHCRRPAGEGDLFAEPQHRLGRRFGEDGTVGRRDVEQLGVRRRRAGGHEHRDDDAKEEHAEPPITAPSWPSAHDRSIRVWNADKHEYRRSTARSHGR